MAKRYEEMTPREKRAVDAVLARRRTPAARAELARAREAVARDFPPARPALDVAALIAELRAERERQGLSLADAAGRTGIDKSYLCRLENGAIPNPTIATLARYAAALRKRLVMGVEDLEPVGP